VKKTFSELFKKYRLRSEFEKLSDLGNALAEKGLYYEDSIFSHWQKGTRVPTNRNLLLILLNIFIEKKAITSLDEVNEFFDSVNHGYLTHEEIKKLPDISSYAAPFQVPREIAHFTGREKLIQILTKQISQSGVFLIYGPSGVGKTALAIHLGHILKHVFPDGILWYKVDTANPMDILLSIAYTFHENISPIQNLETRSSVVRALLANKKILLILDNVEQDSNIRILLPNSSSSVILTSKYQHLSIDTSYESISLESFTNQESLLLFSKILTSSYVKKYQEDMKTLSDRVGNLPLPLHIYAKQLAITKQSPKLLLQQIEESKISLQALLYEDKNLYTSIDISFQSLNEEAKKIFLSLGIFEGKDFSPQAVAAINKMTLTETQFILQNLVNTSLLEESTKQRYRLHPIIKLYIKKIPVDNNLYFQAAMYYAAFLHKNRLKNTKYYNTTVIYPEIENIQYLFERCNKLKAYRELNYLWKDLGMFFRQTGEWDKAVIYGEIAYITSKNNKELCKDFCYTVDTLCWIYYFQGEVEKIHILTLESLQIAEFLQDDYLIALNKQRLGKVYRYFLRIDESLQLLNFALNAFKKLQDKEEIAYTYKFLSEAHFVKKDFDKALSCIHHALDFAASGHNIMLKTYVLSILGSVHYMKNNYALAKKYLKNGIIEEKKFGMRMGLRVYNNLLLALIYKNEKHIKEANKYFNDAKKENQILHITEKGALIYTVIRSLKEDLQKAGYYIFE